MLAKGESFRFFCEEAVTRMPRTSSACGAAEPCGGEGGGRASWWGLHVRAAAAAWEFVSRTFRLAGGGFVRRAFALPDGEGMTGVVWKGEEKGGRAVRREWYSSVKH